MPITLRIAVWDERTNEQGAAEASGSRYDLADSEWLNRTAVALATEARDNLNTTD